MRLAAIDRSAMRRLKQLDVARCLADLRAPPASGLERRRSGGTSRWCVMVNDRFRICFRWTGAGAQDFEVVERH